MRKRVIICASVLAMVFSACEKRDKAYTTFSDSNFTVDFPKGWENEANYNQFTPFVAFSDFQTMKVATRYLPEVTIDSFVQERLDQFMQYPGFNLIEQKIEDEKAFLHYEAGDMVMMTIAKKGDYFYGIDCNYETEAEKDTVETIMRSFSMK